MYDDYSGEDNGTSFSDWWGLDDSCQTCRGKPLWHMVGAEALIVTLGLIFNGIAIFVIIQLKDYKKVVSHWYVLHLSIADFILLLHLPFKTSQHLHGYWIFPPWFCTYNQGIFMTSYYAGILFLTVMSFDRYVAIVHPVSIKWRRIRTRYNANIVTLLVWTLSFLFSVPLWVFSSSQCCACGYNFEDSVKLNFTTFSEESFSDDEDIGVDDDYSEEIDYDYIRNLSETYHGGKSLTTECKNYKWSYRAGAWHLCNFIITFIIPIIVMGICYSLILWRVLHPAITSAHTTSYRRRRTSESSSRKGSLGKMSFRTNSSSSSCSSSRRFSRNGKVTFVVASLVACFLICWFPFHFVNLIRSYDLIKFKHGDGEMCTILKDVTALLAFSNSMLNPILYTFLGSDFRRRLRAATKSFRPRRFSSGFSKSNRSARTSVPHYCRSNGTTTHHKAMEGPTNYPLNPIHSIVSKHYSQDLHERSQFLSTRRTDCSSRCEMEALHFSDMSESRLIH